MPVRSKLPADDIAAATAITGFRHLPLGSSRTKSVGTSISTPFDGWKTAAAHARCRSTSGSCEPHHLQHRPPEQAVGARQRLQHLEMVVALADEERHLLAGG